jgi:hypothetical protein
MRTFRHRRDRWAIVKPVDPPLMRFCPFHRLLAASRWIGAANSRSSALNRHDRVSPACGDREMLSVGCQPCCHIGWPVGRQECLPHNQPPHPAARHRSCERYTVRGPGGHSPTMAGLGQIRDPLPTADDSPRPFIPRCLALIGQLGQRGLAGRVRYLERSLRPAALIGFDQQSHAGLLPRRVALTFPPEPDPRAVCPDILTSSFLPADRPRRLVCAKVGRSRMSQVRLLGFDSRLRGALQPGCLAILPRTFSSCRVADMRCACSRTVVAGPLQLASPRDPSEAPIRSWVFGALPRQMSR